MTPASPLPATPHGAASRDDRSPLAMPTAPTISVVIPVYNKLAFVRACMESVLAAAAARDDVEVVVVDHHSTDGSYEYLVGLAEAHPERVRLMRLAGGTISRVRNTGAAASRGTFLSFIDSDVVVPRDYYSALLRTFDETGAEAVGCEYDIPADPHWSERVWHHLHIIASDGERHYLNGGNFAVRRDAFERVGGFAEHLSTGEDTDISRRLRSAGCRIYEAQCLSAVHLGNPKSVAAFFRKQAWHGESVLDDATLIRGNKATYMLFAFTALCALALVVLVVPVAPFALRLLLALAMVLAVPAATVAYRFLETRRLTNPVAALALYLVYFSARARSLLAALLRPRPAARPG